MKKLKICATLLLATLLFFAISPLAAQSSNVSISAAGIFTNDIDNFMSTTEFGKVEFGKGFLYLGLTSTRRFELGHAMNLGGFYLGTYYNGYIFYGDDKDEIERNTTPVVFDGEIIDESYIYTQKEPKVFSTSNYGSILFGMGNMGFKLSLDQLARIRKFDGMFVPDETILKEEYDANTNILTKTEYKDTYKHDYEYLIPRLDFGMALDLGSMILKPRVAFEIDFNNVKDGDIKTISREFSGDTDGLEQEVRKRGREDKAIDIKPKLGASLLLAKENGSELSFGLNYNFSLKLYSSPYLDETEASQKVKGSTVWMHTVKAKEDAVMKETTTEWSATNIEKSEVYNILNLSTNYKFNPYENLNLGIGGDIGVGFKIDKKSRTEFDYKKEVVEFNNLDPSNDSVSTKETITPGNTEVKNDFFVNPSLKAGLQYQLVPEKFTVNSGVNVSLPNFANTKTTITRSEPKVTREKIVLGDGTVDTDEVTTNFESLRQERQTIENEWGEMFIIVNSGFTWNLNEKAAFDVNLETSPNTIAPEMNLKFTFKY